jgi:hypothetical protein
MTEGEVYEGIQIWNSNKKTNRNEKKNGNEGVKNNLKVWKRYTRRDDSTDKRKKNKGTN